MNGILNLGIRYYKRMVSSIAFIPSIMILFSLILAVSVFYVEGSVHTEGISEYIQFALVHGAENARIILTTIIGGIISLTVFSFSMVMVVLNRASASLSPRVLPQLVAQKFHQFVLGFYMGTIVYSLILIVNIKPGEETPSLGILLSMVMAITSLGLFIYFIHSISESLQVDNILSAILKRTMRQIKKIIDKTDEYKNHTLSEMEAKRQDRITASATGYYKPVNINGLVDYLQQNNIHAEIFIYPGKFVPAGSALVNTHEVVDDQKIKETLQKFMLFTYRIEDEDDYYFGLRKISEIGVKALSPGINDPGTALKATRFLTMLFIEVLHLPTYIIYMDETGENRVYKKLPPLHNLLLDNITPIRQYSGGSIEILTALFDFFYALLGESDQATFDILKPHIQALIDTSDSEIYSRRDRDIINRSIQSINQIPAFISNQFELLAES